MQDRSLGRQAAWLLATVAVGVVARAEDPSADRVETSTATQRFLSVRGYADSLLNFEFGDLHAFNVFFDDVDVAYSFEPVSFELMKQHAVLAGPNANTRRSGWRGGLAFSDWSLSLGEEIVGRLPVAEDGTGSAHYGPIRSALQTTRVTPYATAGVRVMRNISEFYFQGRGSIIGTTTVNTLVEHDIIGPQLGMGMVAETSMFRLEAVTLGLIGYGRINYEQQGVFGAEAIPGALNRSAVASTAMPARNAASHDEFAWHGETRLTASCQITQRLRFDASWRWFVTGPVYNAALATAWNAPHFGFNATEGEAIHTHGWFLGLTYTH